MVDLPKAGNSSSDDLTPTPQPLVGFMTNEGWDKLLAHVDGLVQEMEDLPFPEVKDKVFELLAGIDSIHRESLRRLVRLFKEGVLEKVVTDPAIHTLMELYDLLPPETDENDKGKAKVKFPVAIQVTSNPTKKFSDSPKYPRWIPSLKVNDLEENPIVEVNVDDMLLLLCRAKDKYFALAATCIQDGTSLADATINSYTLVCPNHDACLYDVRDGKRIAASGELECYSVKLNSDNIIMVGLDMPFEPSLPSF